MRLTELIQGIEGGHSGDQDPDVLDVTSDSREVGPGSLFVAIRGEHCDGHSFLQEALSRGAVGAVVEDHIMQVPPAPLVKVPNTRRALALLASRFFHYPSRRLQVVGITGTNGKTTTSYLCRDILESGGVKAGLVGTTGYFLGEEFLPSTHTTPDAVELQRLLARMVTKGFQGVVMEVSSHALSQERVSGCFFDSVIFTNMTHDHLDFHKDFEDYFQAKLKLFTELMLNSPKRGQAIVNIDDPWGRKIMPIITIDSLTYSVGSPADLQAEKVHIGQEGISFIARTPLGEMPVRSPLMGRYNVSNILAAIGAGIVHRVPPDAILRGIWETKKVPGRFERIDEGQPFLVLVDYAHTEDALSRLLRAVSEVVSGRIITLFGCGGNRDRIKRPKMGQVAVRLSDTVIITSDNPRYEDPMQIIHEIEEGVREEATGKEYHVILEREEAIEKALSLAKQGDAVVIAGKGHEEYQVIRDRRIPYDDRQVAREALRKIMRGR